MFGGHQDCKYYQVENGVTPIQTVTETVRSPNSGILKVPEKGENLIHICNY